MKNKVPKAWIEEMIGEEIELEDLTNKNKTHERVK